MYEKIKKKFFFKKHVRKERFSRRHPSGSASACARGTGGKHEWTRCGFTLYYSEFFTLLSHLGSWFPGAGSRIVCIIICISRKYNRVGLIRGDCGESDDVDGDHETQSFTELERSM